jgi:hypothetical protein
MGNHEMAELSGRIILKDGKVLNELFSRSLEARYDGRGEEAFAYFRGLWRSMPLAIRTANRLFISHSTPGLPRLDDFDAAALEADDVTHDLSREGPVYGLLWGRDFSHAAAERLHRVLDADFFIVGHTPCAEGFGIPNERHVMLDSQGPAGCCALLPLDQPLTLAEIAGRIRPLRETPAL